MEHLFAALDWDRAAILAARVGPGELDAGRGERVERWMARFSDEVRARRPHLLLLQARLLTAGAQYDPARDLVARGEYLLAEAGDRPGVAEALVLRGRLAVAAGQGQQMIQNARQALTIAEAPPRIRAQAQHVAAVGYSQIGEGVLADGAYAAALATFTALGDLQSMTAVTSDWGYALVIREELPRAANQLDARSLMRGRPTIGGSRRGC